MHIHASPTAKNYLEALRTALLIARGMSLGSNSSITGLTKGSTGLGNADNTSDARKPFSTAATHALANKSDKDREYLCVG